MKILLFTDNHFCEYSSIVRQLGEKYSVRLENQIQSINYVEDFAIKQNCEKVICLGDFFDKPNLSDIEITALKDIKWSNIEHYFIVGNHESSVNGLKYNSTKILEKSNFHIISEVSLIKVDNRNLVFIPYILESDRKSLKEYLNELNITDNTSIVFSHNDIKDLQMGAFKSEEGFKVKDIEDNCSLFLNGHIHNGGKIASNGYNLGALTGQNFGNDSFKYKYGFFILDTDTLKLEFYENPFALNFYKIDIEKKKDIENLSTLKANSVISIRCIESLLDESKKAIINNVNIIANKIVVLKDVSDSVVSIESLKVDHISKFASFCKEKIENTEILNQELSKICN